MTWLPEDPLNLGASMDKSESAKIDSLIAKISDWRGDVLSRVRALILSADPNIVESVKWAKASNPDGVPVWECNGIVCTGETYKDKVKFTFAKGASVADPQGLFNSGLDGGTRRAIDVFEGDILDEDAWKDLIRSAVEVNSSGTKPK